MNDDLLDYNENEEVSAYLIVGFTLLCHYLFAINFLSSLIFFCTYAFLAGPDRE
jgi:hypothetical protein